MSKGRNINTKKEGEGEVGNSVVREDQAIGDSEHCLICFWKVININSKDNLGYLGSLFSENRMLKPERNQC